MSPHRVACSCFLVLVTFSIFARGGQDAAAKPKPTVPTKQLQALVPEQLAGAKRLKVWGDDASESDPASTASAEFAAREGDASAPRVSIQITDHVNYPGGAKESVSWPAEGTDTETAEGIDRLTKIAGHPAYETYEKNNRLGRIEIVVADRFAVLIGTLNLTPEQIRKAAESLPLDKLAALK